MGVDEQTSSSSFSIPVGIMSMARLMAVLGLSISGSSAELKMGMGFVGSSVRARMLTLLIPILPEKSVCRKNAEIGLV